MHASQHVRSRIVGVNIPTSERLATGLAGAAAVLFGIRRPSLGGVVVAGLGGLAVLRAVTGRCPGYRARTVRRGIHIRRTVTIQATPRQVYTMWRELSNLPRFLRHVTSVTVEEDGISRWVVDMPRGHRLTWRAQIVEDTPDRRLRWRSLPGSDLAHEGEVDIRESPGDRGTIVEVKLHYLPPGGLVIASAFYELLRTLAKVDIGIELVRLRQLLETGEIATGARRVAEAGADKAVRAARVAPRQPRPITTAQTSAHDVGAPTGGPR